MESNKIMSVITLLAILCLVSKVVFDKDPLCLLKDHLPFLKNSSLLKGKTEKKVVVNEQPKKQVRFNDIVSINELENTSYLNVLDPMTSDLNIDSDLITDEDLIDDGNILGDATLPEYPPQISQPAQPQGLINEEPIMSPHPSDPNRPEFEMQTFNEELPMNSDDRVYPYNSYSNGTADNLASI